MRFVSTLLLMMAATTAFAMGVKSEPPATNNPSNPSMPSGTEAQASGPRHEAEVSYSLAYEEIAKAKKDLEAGKAKNAEKKFKKALERVENATGLDPNYHEAWNLMGYCARKLGDYDRAFASYDKCLGIKPDYAPAREYLGEAFLEKSQPEKAREQLVMLERASAEQEADVLRAAIAAYEAAHPEAKPAPASTPAAPDTTTTTKTGE